MTRAQSRSRTRSRTRTRKLRRSPRRRLRGGEAECCPASQTALIVIDVQYDFVDAPVPATMTAAEKGSCAADFGRKEKGSLAVGGTNPASTEGAAFYSSIAELRSKPFRAQIATRDYHPCDHVSFATNNNKGLFSLEHITYTLKDGSQAVIPQVMWPNHCVQNTKGSEIRPEVLRGADFTRTFAKATNRLYDSYSGFGDILTPKGKPKQYDNTGLLQYLKELRITHVVVCGIATDYCVKATASDAAAYGFHVTLVEDACRGVDPRSSADAMAEFAAGREGKDSMGNPMVKVVRRSDEVRLS